MTARAPDWGGIERGAGRPLVLLHGLGMTHAAWAPVMEALARHRRVLALDVPGFGTTPMLPDQTPTLEALATALQHELDRRGIAGPVDVAGNSMGGGIALALALQGGARSVAAISPAGLWPVDSPWHTRPVLRTLRFALRNGSSLADYLLRFGLARRLMLAVPMSVRGDRIPADVARAQAHHLATAPGVIPTLEAIGPLAHPERLNVPCSIAFGRRDWLLTRGAQRRDRVPASVKWSHPAGWGHVPMWDDPAGVATWILDATA